MELVFIGTGYVGLVSGSCFAEMGNQVTCVDTDIEKIEKLNEGIIPIYEPGLELLVKNNVKKKNLFFTTNLSKAIKNSDAVFISVGTPMSDDGSADLQYVLSVANEIGETMTSKLIIVNKSTVPVGTANQVREIIQKKLQARGLNIEYHVVSNPEFLKEGNAINDFMKPDRIVIGSDSEEVISLMKKIYSPFFRSHKRFVTMDIRSAEMTKYAANALLATKISFINEIANICEKVGANINNVRIGVGSDSRIGYDFIYPGIGYGGTCFPKDISELINLGKEKGYTPKLLSSVEKVNKKQKEIFFNKIIFKFGEDLSGLTFAIWGLSFKPETDDMRESPSIYIISKLLEKNAKVVAYDPKAIDKSKKIYLKDFSIKYGVDKYDVLANVDALILLTEWKEFRLPDFKKMKELMRSSVIFDGRNQYDQIDISKDFEYYQIGKI